MKALICITTSKRSLAVKTFVWDYIAFCRNNPNYDFVISLDGCDKQTIEFCNAHKIPIVYSETQEGVGLSKNRILSTFSKCDNYFFIEDDVGLLNGTVFDLHIKTSQELNIHHMSLFPEERIGGKACEITLKDGRKVIGCMFGGAQFNYFTKKGISIVGGFHTYFSKYRRFGHTEHSYRFVNSGLAEYPFYVLSDCLHGYLRWSDPVSVTKIKVDTINRLFVEEHKLIEQKLAHFPLATLTSFHTPGNLDLEQAKKPLCSGLYRVQFECYMAALSVYREMKKMWSGKNER
jgi:hypothetical protein